MNILIRRLILIFALVGSLFCLVKMVEKVNIAWHKKIAKIEQQKQESLKNARIQALIDTIAESEGGKWHICFGGIKANYNLQYPCSRRKIGKYTSSAFGAFQILDNTWYGHAPTECKKITKDNSKLCQIKVVKSILKSRGLLDDIERGEINFKELGKIWSSLPSSQYGQPIKFGKNEFIAKYKKNISEKLDK